jgi:uncharacterized integral membrane protein
MDYPVARRSDRLIGVLVSAHLEPVSKQATTILVTVLGTLITILVLQNIRQVTVRFVIWQGDFSLAVLLPAVFFGGVVAGWFWRKRNR